MILSLILRLIREYIR